jgi:hydrogenase-1 operon protein HyaF
MSAAGGSGPTGNGAALLQELATLLCALAERDEAASIDLRALPLSPGDFKQLRDTLGAGVVQARVDALGESCVAETGFPGIWWVTHCNEAGDTVAELIEVCVVPEILRAPADDIVAGAVHLADRLRDIAAAGAMQP